MWTRTVSAPTSDRPPRKHLCGPAEKICLCRRESRTGGEQISAEQFLNRTALLCNAGFGKPALLGVCAAAAGALAAGLFESSRERKTLTVPEYVIRSTKLHGRARRLVFLTDLHDCEFGKDNEEKIVRVTDVEYLQPEEAPFPMEKTKKLIRRLTPEEYEKYVEEGEDY